MDQNWARDVARKAAVEKVEQAETLLREAKEIFHSNGYDHASLTLGEALKLMPDDEAYCEWRMVMTRHGMRTTRRGRAYIRVSAADEQQARRFVAEEIREGHRAWLEFRTVTPWKKES
jgi:hypothetical protein